MRYSTLRASASCEEIASELFHLSHFFVPPSEGNPQPSRRDLCKPFQGGGFAPVLPLAFATPAAPKIKAQTHFIGTKLDQMES